MNRKGLVKKIGLVSLAISLFGINVMAATYEGYTLPARQGNNYTGTHSKTTTNNYITNTVNDLENTDEVTFWACNSSEDQISGDYDQKLSNTSTIKFNKSGYNKVGKEIILGMENANYYWVDVAFVAGTVNYQ